MVHVDHFIRKIWLRIEGLRVGMKKKCAYRRKKFYHNMSCGAQAFAVLLQILYLPVFIHATERDVSRGGAVTLLCGFRSYAYQYCCLG